MRVRAPLAVAAAAIGLLVILAGSLAFGPLVRGAAIRQARARGVELTVKRVWPGFGRIWLEGVSIGLPRAPSVRADLARVEVVLGLALQVRRVRIYGGDVVVRGAPEVVHRELEAWVHPSAREGGSGPGGFAALSGEGIAVTWVEAFPGAAAQHVWGLAFVRTGSRTGTVRADLAQFAYRSGSLEVASPSLAFGEVDGRSMIEEMQADGVTARFDLSDGLPSLPGAPAAAPASKAEPLADLLWTVGLQRTIFGFARAFATMAPTSGSVVLASLRLEVRRGAETIAIGPGRLELRRVGTALRASFRPGGAHQATPLEAFLVAPVEGGEIHADVNGGPVTLTALGIAEGSFGLVDVGAADVAAKGRVTLTADGRRLRFDGRAALRHISIAEPSLSPTPLAGIDLGWHGRGEVAADGSLLDVAAGELSLGAARVQVAGRVERDDAHLRGNLSARVTLAACQSLLASAPRGLAPMLDGVSLEGTFALRASAEFDTRRPAATRVTWDMANECRVAAVPPSLHPQRFAAPWEREVIGADRRRMSIESGPGTPSWVPLDRISPHMVTGLLICEDARFFRHRGFDQEAIASALRDNIGQRRFFRGASTLTMQLAKNLYLSREKTLARKLEEAVFTILLEQSLDKEAIVELYLNVVEFGPGIYGIAPAAEHYFRSRPDQLSLGQALYLASILPNPRSQHFGADGRVTDRWRAYLDKLMVIAKKIGRITDTELEAALAEPIVFQTPSTLGMASEGAVGLGVTPGDAALADALRDSARLGVEASPSAGDAAAERETVPRAASSARPGP